jgi:hypothetical protein
VQVPPFEMVPQGELQVQPETLTPLHGVLLAVKVDHSPLVPVKTQMVAPVLLVTTWQLLNIL